MPSRVPADDIFRQAENLGLLDVLKRLLKQGEKLDDITVDTLRAAQRADVPTHVRVTPGQPLPHNPMDLVPPGANQRTLTPHPGAGSQQGVEYKWDQDGQTVRMRGHSPDGTAPPGSNAASGDTYRVQIGGRYMDADGNLHPRGVHNPDSPNYNPQAANDTHIPWPSDVPVPWS